MKTLIAALLISTVSQASVLYTCSSDDGYVFTVERTDRNDLHVDVEAPADKPTIGYFCYGSDNESNKSLKVHSRAEIIGEDPSSCTFKLNKRTLEASYEYKRWSGYFRGPFLKPVQKANKSATCVAAE